MHAGWCSVHVCLSPAQDSIRLQHAWPKKRYASAAEQTCWLSHQLGILDAGVEKNVRLDLPAAIAVAPSGCMFWKGCLEQLTVHACCSAYGMLEALVGNNVRLDLPAAVAAAADLQAIPVAPEARAAVADFVTRRLEQLLVDGGCCVEAVRAALAERGADPALAAATARDLQARLPCGPDLLLICWVFCDKDSEAAASQRLSGCDAGKAGHQCRGRLLFDHPCHHLVSKPFDSPGVRRRSLDK